MDRLAVSIGCSVSPQKGSVVGVVKGSVVVAGITVGEVRGASK